MILFGLPAPAPDDAARAAECAINLSIKTERWIKAHRRWSQHEPASRSARITVRSLLPDWAAGASTYHRDRRYRECV